MLQINKSQRFVQVGDIKIGLTDVNYTFYLWVLGRILNGEPVRRMIDDNTAYAEEFMAVYRDHVKGLKDDDRTRETLRLGMSSQWLSERISAVRKSFELALGPQAAKPFLVQSSGGNNNRIYSIALTEEQICYL